MITYTATVKIDGEVRTYTGDDEEPKVAKFKAEKKARTFLRRRNLSVKMANVERVCPDCGQRTEFIVRDLIVPDRQEIEADEFDWLLDN